MSAIALMGILATSGFGPAAQASPSNGSLRSTSASAPSGLWTCKWAPTMDYNWHNDALCSNGVQKVRPHLRPNDSHITRDELMSSARAWARARNKDR